MSLTGNFDKLYHVKDKADIFLNNENIKHYSFSEIIRTLCFVHVEGEKFFINYNYLISGEFLPEKKLINLFYTTHIVTLKGYNLEILFDNLSSYIPKLIKCDDKRYKALKNITDVVVTEISIKSSK